MSNPLDANRPVKVWECGVHFEVVQTAVEPMPPKVRRIDANTYINEETGELITARRSTARNETPENVMKTVNRLRRLVNANVDPARGDIFLTLTYDPKRCGGVMRDAERVMDDWERMRRKLVQMYRPFEYIAVIEPQQSGSWHLHVIILTRLMSVPDPVRRKKDWYRLNLTLGLLWGQGFAHVRNLRECDNVGLYLASYLVNDGSKKRARLQYYPRGIRIYRCSRGVVRPKPEVMSYAAAMDKLAKADTVLAYWQETRLQRDDGHTIQIVRHCYFAPPGSAIVAGKSSVVTLQARPDVAYT